MTRVLDTNIYTCTFSSALLLYGCYCQVHLDLPRARSGVVSSGMRHLAIIVASRWCGVAMILGHAPIACLPYDSRAVGSFSCLVQSRLILAGLGCAAINDAAKHIPDVRWRSATWPAGLRQRNSNMDSPPKGCERPNKGYDIIFRTPTLVSSSLSITTVVLPRKSHIHRESLERHDFLPQYGLQPGQQTIIPTSMFHSCPILYHPLCARLDYRLDCFHRATPGIVLI